MKRIYLVYQDCALCGEKGREVLNYAVSEGIQIVKVGFTEEKAEKLIHDAVFKHKIGSMPFFTDGTKFSKKLSDFVEKKQVKTSKSKKVKENKKNESASKN